MEMITLSENFRKKELFYLLIAFLISSPSLLSSCYYDNEQKLYGNTICDTVGVSYSADIIPILEANCYSCHSDEQAELEGSDNFLEGYDKLMNYVEPNDPENSLFYASIAWLPGTSFMPRPTGTPQLSDCNIALVASWINAGAPEN